jgi:hypothetical protein
MTAKITAAATAEGAKAGTLRGLPGPLPADERILWRGGPDTMSLARHGFRLRLLAGYFAALVVLGAVSAVSQGEAGLTLTLTMLRCLALAGAGVSLVLAYAWMVRRSAVYTVTNKRVVLCIGIAFPVMLNVPYAAVETAGLVLRADGSGDISLRLIPPAKFAYIILWPHARPWHFTQPQPMLRAVPDAARVAQTLSRALAAAAGVPAPLAPRMQDATATAGSRAAAAA